MSPLNDMNPQQLKAVLDDTQASLAAALGRIEAFRIREKQILSELSTLRQQVHGGADPTSAPPAPVAVGGARPAPAQPAPAAQPPQTAAAAAAPAAPSEAKLAGVQPAWASPSGQPVYVSNLEGEYPVHILNGSKKVPGSLVVTKEHIDFVEVRAHIRQEDFVGISSVKGAEPSPLKARGGMGMLLCCAAPPPAPFSDAAPPPGSSACKGENGEVVAGETGVWQMLWSRNGVPQRQAFEAAVSTREVLHRHTQRWLGQDPDVATAGQGQAGAAADGDHVELAVPRNLIAGGEFMLRLVGEHSLVLHSADLRACLASAVPPLERMKDWTLSYSTAKHGISLQTLYRKAIPGLPSILLVRDFGGYSFGCYTPDSWHVAPRYYGSGETFVFQLEPFRVAYPWRSLSKEKNDFFQYGTPECLAVGGLGHFAIWLDSELLHGSSGTCGTFGSPCLAAAEDFKIQAVELWQATA